VTTQRDLTVEPGEQERPEEPELVPPVAAPYDPEPARERIRGWLALGLTLLLASTVAAAFVALLTN
jgi:hypothetical protein